MPLAGATVSVRSADSTRKVIPVIANDSGVFQIDPGTLKDGFIDLSYAGFVTESIPWSLTHDGLDFRISLLPVFDEGTGAVVIGRRPAMELKGDTLTLNVASMPGGDNSSAAELLDQVPMAAKDPNGNLQIKGQQPRILIDDKPVELRADQLKDFLESLPGSMIERIEVLQNPGGEFAAEGSAVINIITNKSKTGITGRVNASVGSIGEQAAGVNLGYKTAKWNSLFSASYRQRQTQGYGNSTRDNFFADSTNQYLSSDSFSNTSTPINIRWQADFVPDKYNDWNFVLNYTNNSSNTNNDTRFEQWNRFDELWQLSTRRTESGSGSWVFSPQLNYGHKWRKNGASLKINLQYSIGENDNLQYFRQQFLDPKNQNIQYKSNAQRQSIDGRTTNFVGRANYNLPLIKKLWSLQAGATLNLSANPQAVETEVSNDINGNVWEVAPLLSASLRFKQDVVTARLGQNLTLKKQWRFYAQLQFEQTWFSAVPENGAGRSNTYSNWLPYLRLRKEWGKTWNSNLMYRQSIRRPTYNQLSPVVYINDPFNLRTGNPLLVPTTTDELEWNLQFNKGKSFVNNAFTYRSVADIIQPIRTLTDTGVTVTTYQNLASSRQYSYDFGWGISFSKQWRMNASGAYRYTTYPEEQREKFRFQNGYSVNASLQINWQPNLVWAASAGMSFNRYASPQGVARSNIGNRFALQYKFANRRWVASAVVNDPFTPQNQLFITTGTRFYAERFRTIRTRNYQLGIAWQFQKVSEKKPAAKPAHKLLQTGAKNQPLKQ